MLYTILYTTNSKQTLSHKELLQLEKSLQTQSKSLNITGCLAYIEGITYGNTKCQCIHVLEGLKDDVETIFDQVKLDPRQKNLAVIKVGFIKSRKFNEWSMGCERLQLDHNPILRAFFYLNHNVMIKDGCLEENMLMQFIRTFCKEKALLTCMDLIKQQPSILQLN